MIKRLKILLQVGVAGSWLFGSHYDANAQEADITELIINSTSADEELSRNCERVAIGNEKKCEIKQIKLIKDQENYRAIFAHLQLTSRHRITSDIIAYSDTINVEITASFDYRTCYLKSLSASTSNDLARFLLTLQDIESELRSQASPEQIDRVCVNSDSKKALELTDFCTCQR